VRVKQDGEVPFMCFARFFVCWRKGERDGNSSLKRLRAGVHRPARRAGRARVKLSTYVLYVPDIRSRSPVVDNIAMPSFTVWGPSIRLCISWHEITIAAFVDCLVDGLAAPRDASLSMACVAFLDTLD
jgi:hypothetical protein